MNTLDASSEAEVDYVEASIAFSREIIQSYLNETDTVGSDAWSVYETLVPEALITESGASELRISESEYRALNDVLARRFAELTAEDTVFANAAVHSNIAERADRAVTLSMSSDTLQSLGSVPDAVLLTLAIASLILVNFRYEGTRKQTYKNREVIEHLEFQISNAPLSNWLKSLATKALALPSVQQLLPRLLERATSPPKDVEAIANPHPDKE